MQLSPNDGHNAEFSQSGNWRVGSSSSLGLASSGPIRPACALPLFSSLTKSYLHGFFPLRPPFMGGTLPPGPWLRRRRVLRRWGQLPPRLELHFRPHRDRFAASLECALQRPAQHNSSTCARGREPRCAKDGTVPRVRGKDLVGKIRCENGICIHDRQEASIAEGGVKVVCGGSCVSYYDKA